MAGNMTLCGIWYCATGGPKKEELKKIFTDIELKADYAHKSNLINHSSESGIYSGRDRNNNTIPGANQFF